MRPAKTEYYIYTDGSCRWTEIKKNNHGGWAFVVISSAPEVTENFYRSGFEEGPQTNQTMELYGVLNALRYVKEFGLRTNPVTIYTDSTYVIGGMESAFRHQVADGLIDPPHKELWLLLHRHAEKCKQLEFLHIKGHYKPTKPGYHQGHVWNDLCDKMASRARTEGTTALLLKRRKEQ